jgi:hypothetical protein
MRPREPSEGVLERIEEEDGQAAGRARPLSLSSAAGALLARKFLGM